MVSEISGSRLKDTWGHLITQSAGILQVGFIL